jgi:ribosomal protein S18 acetylase RimI-like enzyme
VPEIRTARPEDAERLREIDLLTWDPTVSPGPRKAPETPFFDERLAPADALVAVEGDEVCGFALWQQHAHMPSHAHVLLINGLAVVPGHQGRGTGRLLLEAAKEEAVRRGARKLTLRVLSSNARARRLYESEGFEVEGRLRGEFVLEGRDVDDLLMACWLDAPASPA